MTTPIAQAEIMTALTSLPGWSYSEDKLHKRFTFNNFREAISFIVRIAFSAEQLDHHPEITNIYNHVDLALTTHDTGDKVTAKDIELAQAIERFNWTAVRSA